MINFALGASAMIALAILFPSAHIVVLEYAKRAWSWVWSQIDENA